MSSERYTAEQLEEQIQELLDQHRDATVFVIEPGNYEGVDPDHPGVADIVAQGFDVEGPVEALDRLHPDSRAVGLTAIERCADTGVICDAAHLVDGTPVASYLFDTLETRKLYLGLQVPTTGERMVPATRADEVLPGRVARIGTDGVGRVLWVDTSEATGLDEVGGRSVGTLSIEFVHPDDFDRVRVGWAEMLAHPETVHRLRFRRRVGDGWRWFEASMTNRLADPEEPHVELEVVDISREMEALEEIRHRERLLDRLAEALPQAILQLDREGRVVYSNRLVRELFDERIDEIGTLIESAVADDRSVVASAVDESLLGADHDLEARLVVPGRPRQIVVELVLRALSDGGGRPDGVICCISDVTERAQLRENLELRATFDPLTGLHNRDSTIRALDVAMAEGQGNGGVAVVFIDLDGFKVVNDSFGHSVGDEVLRSVADRLAAAVRGRDIVGRIGGDEFLVVCPEVADVEAALATAVRIASVLDPDAADAHVLHGIGASLGVSWTVGDEDPESLMARADRAMYLSKQEGSGRPVLADP